MGLESQMIDAHFYPPGTPREIVHALVILEVHMSDSTAMSTGARS